MHDRPTFADLNGCLADAVSEIHRAYAAFVERRLTPNPVPRGILMVGPPGISFTMLARRTPSIMSIGTIQAGRLTKIYRNVGIFKDDQEWTGGPPFRAPHHTVSPGALAGAMRHGEYELASGGVLFLDELAEFSSVAISALARRIDISENGAPLIMASSPLCPCGFAPQPGVTLSRKCSCTIESKTRFLRRMRKYATMLHLDNLITVTPLTLGQLRDGEKQEEADRS